jgi:diguanylate cyclase (GGDEF)-like protein
MIDARNTHWGIYMHSTIILDLFSIIPLLFTINLANRHLLRNPKNKYYMLASLVTILLLVIEILSTFLNVPGNSAMIIPHSLINILGFSISPAIPYFMVYFIGNPKVEDTFKPLFTLPLFLNAMLCIASFYTGWMFSLNLQNGYIRGPLFFFTAAVTFFYFIFAIISAIKARYTFGKSEKFFFLMILFLPLISMFIQFMRPEILTLWGGVSMALLLFYIFSLEQNFEFDNQTKVRNREGFEREMKKTASKDTTVFVFDLNNLKKANDLHGHKAGDALLYDVASTLQRVFSNYGNTFRIGGDEFCVLCNGISEQTSNLLIESLLDHIRQINSSRMIPIDLAYGFTHYKPKTNNSIFAAFSLADNAMYEQKAKYKLSQLIEQKE